MDFSTSEIIALWSIASLFIGVFVGHVLGAGKGQ